IPPSYYHYKHPITPAPMLVAPILDPYREETLTKNVSKDLLKQRTLPIKLIVCLDRFIQMQIISNNVKATIDAYKPEAFDILIEDLRVPNRANFTEKDLNRYSGEETSKIEMSFENGTEKWVNNFFRKVKVKEKSGGRTPKYK